MKKSNKKLVYAVLGVLALVFAVYLVMLPVRKSLSLKYFELGNEMLVERRYISAQVEYKKANYLYHKKESDDNYQTAGEAEIDILKLESFLRAENAKELLNKLNEAKKVPKEKVDAVKSAKTFLEQNEPQLAVLSAQTATEMDTNYRDAWLYLGIAYFECSQKLELKSENVKWYKSKASDALNKAKQLDPTYQPTLNYLKQLET